MTATLARRLSPARRVTLIVGGLFAAALIAWGTWSLISLFGQVTEEHQLTLTPTTRQLTIETDGEVRVVAGSGGDVQIVERIRRSIGRPRVQATSTGDGVVLRGDCRWYSTNCAVSFQVTVPRDLAVIAHSSGGDITVNGLAGSLRLDSSAGDVVATGLQAGQVDARSSGGDVRLTFDTAPTRVVAHSSAGDVEVGLPRVDGGYRVHADTSAGDQQVQVPTDPVSDRVIDVTSSAGDVTVRTT